MSCSQIGVSCAEGECNADNTRTYTITITNPLPDAPFDFDIDFENDGTYDESGTLTAAGTPDATYTTTHDYMSGMTHRLRVNFLFPDGFTVCDDYTDIAVPTCCCLEITEIDVDDDCDTTNCTRDVEIEVENCGTADATVTQIVWGDGVTETLPSTDNPNTAITAGSDEEFVHAYDATTAGTYNATFTFDTCDDLTSDNIVIDACECGGSAADCPQVTIAWGSEGKCDENCEKSIDVTVNVTADTSLTYEIEFVLDGSTYTLTGTGTQSFGPYTATGKPGDTINATSTIISPTGCGSSSTSQTISDCDCPNIDIDFKEGDCKGDKREVIVTATVDGSCSSESIEANLLINGTEVDTTSGTGSITLADTDQYTIGDTITAEVQITSPKDCDSESKDYTVTECDDDTTTTTTTEEEEDTCKTNPVCCWLCGLIIILGVLFTLSGLIAAAGIWLPYSAWIALVFGIFWGIFILWAIIQCDDCYVVECVLKSLVITFVIIVALLLLTAFGFLSMFTIIQLLWMLLICGLAILATYALYKNSCT